MLAYTRQGNGAPLVLVHGFPLDHTIWEPLLPYLTPHFDVILPDLSGFGDSPALETAPAMDAFATTLAGLLDALHLPQAFVAGHSMGGYVALAFARRYSQKLLGLGLVATQSLPDTPERKAGRYATAEQVAEWGSIVVAEAMSPNLSANPLHAPLLKELILRQSPIGVISALKAMAERPDSTNLLSTFSFPVTIAHGLADGLIPPERSREMKALIQHANLTELPEIAHMPMMEAPQETAGVLKSLLP
jgi:3-oxoadipate enol-lactonase